MKCVSRLAGIILVALLVASCRKPASANWDVDLVIPVVNSSLNIKNFLSDTLLKSDNTGLLHLAINREVASVKLDSLLNLPDTTVALSYTMPINYTLAPGTVLNIFPPGELNFNIGNGARLRRADIRKCLVNVKFSNDASQPLQIVYSLPGATKNGNSFRISEIVPPGKNSLIKSYDLAGYSLSLRGANGNFYNSVVQNYTVSVVNNAPEPAMVSAGIFTLMEISYEEVVPEMVEGYFGQQTIVLPPDTALLGFTQSFKATNFMLSEANMQLKLLNELGAEFNGTIEQIRAINSTDNKNVLLQTNQLSNLNINRATRQNNVVSASVKPFTFNNSNSNLAPFISVLPNKLAYQGTVSINPLGNISGYNDFAYYNTGLRLMADIDIPVRFNADYFTLTSKSSVNFSGTEQLDNVRGGNFVIMATNGYPFDANLQAYLLDEKELVIDSLFVGGANTLQRGVLNAQNVVVTPAKSQIYMPVNSSKIANLKKCRFIKVNSKFIVPAGPSDVKIMDNYQFDLNIVAELTYNVSAGNN